MFNILHVAHTLRGIWCWVLSDIRGNKKLKAESVFIWKGIYRVLVNQEVSFNLSVSRRRHKKAVLLEVYFAKALLKQLVRFLGRNAVKDSSLQASAQCMTGTWCPREAVQGSHTVWHGHSTAELYDTHFKTFLPALAASQAAPAPFFEVAAWLSQVRGISFALWEHPAP